MKCEVWVSKNQFLIFDKWIFRSWSGWRKEEGPGEAGINVTVLPVCRPL